MLTSADVCYGYRRVRGGSLRVRGEEAAALAVREPLAAASLWRCGTQFFFYGPRLLQLVFFFRYAYAEKRQRLLQLVSLLPPLSGAAVLILLSLLSQLALLVTTSKY
jgi:hypothetical protein